MSSKFGRHERVLMCFIGYIVTWRRAEQGTADWMWGKGQHGTLQKGKMNKWRLNDSCPFIVYILKKYFFGNFEKQCGLME